MIAVNKTPIQPTIFPDGTSQVWKLDESIFSQDHVEVEWEFEQESELFHLVQLDLLLSKKNIRYTLFIPFLPYARQDKFTSNNTTFALFSFAHILNTLSYEKCYTIDVHSDMATTLINRSESLYPSTFIGEAIWKTSPDEICYPDKGALERYGSTVFHSNIYFDKVRNQLTGEIEGLKLNGNVKDKRILIVDDICDGGRTFIEASKELYKAGAKEVYLYVTHGIFSKGLTVLKDAGIMGIYTRKGIVDQTRDGYIVYKEIK